MNEKLTFKELRTSGQVYLLNKANEIYLAGKVVNRSEPHFPDLRDMGVTSLPTVQNVAQMVVDVTVETEKGTSTYSLPADSSVHAIGTLLISTDTNCIIGELRATVRECDEYLAAYDKRKQMKSWAEGLISDLDVEYKEKKEINDRIAKLETSFGNIEKGQSELLAMMKKLTGK